MAPGRVDERRELVGAVSDEELRDHDVLLAVARVAGRHPDDPRHEDPEQENHRIELRGRPPRDREEDAEPDDEEQDRHHHGGLLLPSLHRLRLLGVHDLPALPRRDDADLRLVRVLRVVVDDEVLELVPRDEFRHRPREHRLPRAGVADQEHVPLLLRRLPDDLDGGLLSDDLVDEALRDLDLRCAPEVLCPNPSVDPLRFIRHRNGIRHRSPVHKPA